MSFAFLRGWYNIAFLRVGGFGGFLLFCYCWWLRWFGLGLCWILVVGFAVGLLVSVGCVRLLCSLVAVSLRFVV